MKVCIDCPALIPKNARAGRCANCNSTREAARGNSNTRGYGAEHQKLRNHYADRMARGEVFTCWRCNKPIAGPFDLGHVDGDKSRYQGPEHPTCNRATNAHRKAAQTPS